MAILVKSGLRVGHARSSNANAAALSDQSPEGDLAVAVGLDDDHGRLDQVEMVAVPYIGLDDPPPADQLTVHGCANGGASASSLGSRTRL